LRPNSDDDAAANEAVINKSAKSRQRATSNRNFTRR
jgi:hypothetical protein